MMHRNPSVMESRFSRVPAAEIPRSSFDRSCGHKTTFDAGYLVPFFVDEALPGDTFNLRSTLFARLATPIAPVMDNMYMDTHFFAVPMRLVWDNWQRFNGEQDDPEDSTDFVIPSLNTSAGFGIGDIGDYFGIPTGVPIGPSALVVSALPFRAYNLIWNQWFRDQNLQPSVPVSKGDGPDDPAQYSLLRRGKRHDYFTSCLPWPQKGPGVQIPLGSVAPVNLTDFTGGPQADVQAWANRDSGGVYSIVGPTGTVVIPNGSGARFEADLSQATAATINSLRQAFQVQKIYERDARGGTRYTEIIKSHFGVSSPDARLQRPEYLGGGSVPISVNPVVQTAPTGTYAETPQGNLAAFGTGLGSGHGFTMSFTEHCIIIGLVSVRADLNYQQGLDRMWSRRTRFDFYWPALAHIGEQAVLNKEIYAQGSAVDDDVFGYQERYAEYRYKPSKITGLFRSSAGESLDVWHLAQDFETLPSLNPAFIEENPPIDRVIAVPEEPHFLLDTYTKLKCARPMPVYGVPGLIDHF